MLETVFLQFNVMLICERIQKNRKLIKWIKIITIKIIFSDI